MNSGRPIRSVGLERVMYLVLSVFGWFLLGLKHENNLLSCIMNAFYGKWLSLRPFHVVLCQPVFRILNFLHPISFTLCTRVWRQFNKFGYFVIDLTWFVPGTNRSHQNEIKFIFTLCILRYEIFLVWFGFIPPRCRINFISFFCNLNSHFRMK